MSNPVLAKQFQKALALWPTDALRPHLSFAAAMQRRMARKPATETEINAMFSLLEDRYARKYPLSPATWKPASNPSYYENLAEEMRQAPRRSWFARYVNSWKGFLRFK